MTLEKSLDAITLPWYYKRMLPQSRLTAQGQISVPAEIRRKLGLGPGSVLEWDEENGQVIVRKSGRFSSEDIHNAVFAKQPKPRSLDELKAGIRKHIRDKHARD